MESTKNAAPFPAAPTAILWCARILTALLLFFFAYMVVGHLVGDAGQATRPLNAGDYAGMIAMGVSVLGLVVAMKWPKVGALIALFSFAVETGLQWRILASPLMFIPLAAIMYLASDWHRTERPSTRLQSD